MAKDDPKKQPKKAKHVFRQDSKDFKYLLRLFQNGDITSTEQPASIRARYPERYNKYTTGQFRSQFNKAKGIAGGNFTKKTVVDGDTPDDDDDDDDDDNEPLTARPAFEMVERRNTARESEEDTVRNNEEVLFWSPKKIVTQYTNADGVRCITLLFALTGGIATEDNSGVEVEVVEDGLQVAIAEKWGSFMTNMEAFYHHFPRDPRESDQEFDRRRFAMMDTVRTMKANGQDDCLTSVYRCPLPFRVDPTEKRVIFTGTSQGCRFCHVDLAERKKVQLQRVVMMDSKRSRQFQDTPSKNEYAKLSF